MIKNYIAYLEFLDNKLSAFFEQQKPYIFCQKGCAKCCKHAQFPYSQIEAIYLMQGMQTLNNEIFYKVIENIKKN